MTITPDEVRLAIGAKEITPRIRLIASTLNQWEPFPPRDASDDPRARVDAAYEAMYALALKKEKFVTALKVVIAMIGDEPERKPYDDILTAIDRAPIPPRNTRGKGKGKDRPKAWEALAEWLEPQVREVVGKKDLDSHISRVLALEAEYLGDDALIVTINAVRKWRYRLRAQNRTTSGPS